MRDITFFYNIPSIVIDYILVVLDIDSKFIFIYFGRNKPLMWLKVYIWNLLVIIIQQFWLCNLESADQLEQSSWTTKKRTDTQHERIARGHGIDHVISADVFLELYAIDFSGKIDGFCKCRTIVLDTPMIAKDDRWWKVLGVKI